MSKRSGTILHGLVRVRGCFGGHFTSMRSPPSTSRCGPARARAWPSSVRELLGERQRELSPRVPSGLPAATAGGARNDGARLPGASKAMTHPRYTAVVSSEGIVTRGFAALRESIGNDAELMVDLHWKFSADEAIALSAKPRAVSSCASSKRQVKPGGHRRSRVSAREGSDRGRRGRRMVYRL